MSTTAISSSSIFQELQSFYQNRQSDLKQLGSALQSGDLSGAQQAFNALAALGQDGPFANSEPFSRSSRAQAFDAVGQALQSGDLAGAQAAFAALTAKQGQSQSTPATVVNLSNTQNIEPLTSGSIYQQLHNYHQQRRADLAQLGQDLQSGDLAAAQQDVSALTALGQSGPNRNGQVFQRADRAQDFQAISQALQSGDLAGAQAAFTSLESTFGKQSQQAQVAASAYTAGATEIVINFVPPASTGTSTPPVSTTPPTEPPTVQPPSTTAGASTTALPEIVINLGGSSSGSGASVSIDAVQGQNGNSEQITINLGQQKNLELIVNLASYNSTSASQPSSTNSLSVSA